MRRGDMGCVDLARVAANMLTWIIGLVPDASSLGERDHGVGVSHRAAYQSFGNRDAAVEQYGPEHQALHSELADDKRVFGVWRLVRFAFLCTFWFLLFHRQPHLINLLAF